MTRRALIVGVESCPAAELRGPEHDVAEMRRVLTGKRFEFEEVPLSNPSHDGIMTTLRKMCSEAGAGDSILFYFSGHGAQIFTPGATEDVREAICPNDFDWDVVERAITDDQLHTEFDVALAKGARVTAILDCCYAGGLPVIDVLRRLLRLAGERVRSHIDDLSEELTNRFDLVGVRSIPPPGNPLEPLLESLQPRTRSRRISKFARESVAGGKNAAIVFGACGVDQIAKEHAFGDKYMGVFTHHLVRVLDDAHPGMTNLEVRDAVRAAAAAAHDDQVPIAHPTDPDEVFLE